MTMKNALALLLALMAALPVGAQGLESVLQGVEQNNKELQAIRHDNEATAEEVAARNNLSDPSVEYSPFFRKGESGVASSELVVSQGFDFPTLYAARRKSGRLHREALGLQYLTARRDILLQAKLLCLDLVKCAQDGALLGKRRADAEALLAMMGKRLESGDATMLDVNKVKMDLMAIRSEETALEAARNEALQSLAALNGNVPVAFSATDYERQAPPDGYEAMVGKAMAADYGVRASQASEQALAQDLKASRQGWAPKLEVGYRRNTEGRDASHGFMVGASFPLFSARSGVKVAKAQHAGAQLRAENARIEVETRLKAQVGQLQELEKAKAAYDVGLMTHTLDLLRKAVEGGQLTVIEYYAEADAIYRNLQAYNEIVRQYQGVMAEIYKNDL